MIQDISLPKALGHDSACHLVHNEPLSIFHVFLELSLVVLTVLLVEELASTVFESLFEGTHVFTLRIV